MLIITKVFTRKRPHVPRTKQDMWCVRDTKLNRIVHGPTKHTSCIKFMEHRC